MINPELNSDLLECRVSAFFLFLFHLCPQEDAFHHSTLHFRSEEELEHWGNQGCIRIMRPGGAAYR